MAILSQGYYMLGWPEHKLEQTHLPMALLAFQQPGTGQRLKLPGLVAFPLATTPTCILFVRTMGTSLNYYRS